MSRIYFHSQSDGDAEVSGAERAWLSYLATGAAIGAAGLADPLDGHWIFRALRHDVPPKFLLSQLRHGRAMLRGPDGREYAAIDTLLNTAVAIGSPAIQLAARIDGYCEGHCYVEGPNRVWLADIIDKALQANIFRRSLHGHPMGWDGVVSLLRCRDNKPVVLSYSVCDSFPNGHVAGWKDDEDGDGWLRLPAKKRWSLAMAAIRRDPWLELKPETLGTPPFSSGTTLFALDAAWRSVESLR